MTVAIAPSVEVRYSNNRCASWTVQPPDLQPSHHVLPKRNQKTRPIPSFWYTCSIPVYTPAANTSIFLSPNILFGVGSLIYTNYIYNTYIIGAFHKFPEPVAQRLRRALYYTNISLSPPDALKYYRQALTVADELGMDPFSDEILGVKFQIVALMEKSNQYQKAIDVLELVRRDCLKWIELLGEKPGNEGKRTRILGKQVGISVKLGDLYSGEYIQEREKAEEAFVWAVETVLKEKKRREEQGVKEGEGDWMTDEEIGASLETLGNHYESKDLHYLAAPLYLQCLSLIPSSNCHSVVLSISPSPSSLNNLSISLAQQHPPSSSTSPHTPASTQIASARAWATKALEIASTIKPPNRTEECDIGCAVATHNLGELLEMEGDKPGARKRYEEARSIAKAVAFQEGVERAGEALRRNKKGE
ncbi:MAG: hypothetical protein M1835_000189 [Candelina submexicana]|nr:MAG: hypothetical protein M1835_000189 [Candelina submexicana]